MKYRNRMLFRTCAVMLAGLAISLTMFNSRNTVAAAVPGATPPANPTCYPSCSPVDPRMFSLAGDELFTFGGGSTTIGLRVNGALNPPNFVIGIFDGDGGGLWDQGATTLNFQLFADQNGDGIPEGGEIDTLPIAAMQNNAWVYFTVTNNASARVGGLGTDYVYQLKASLVNANGEVQNSFKVAADSAQTQLFITPQVLSFQAFLNGPENPIIHPFGDPQTNPSNYDGIWNFSFLITNQTSINIWDGDFDIGNLNEALGKKDGDDLTTPPIRPDETDATTLPALLRFDLNGAQDVHPEGIAFFQNNGGPIGPPGVGNPPDNNFDGPFSFFFRRIPAAPHTDKGVITRLIPPGGGTPFLNDNPSGTNEYELFRVATNQGNALLDSFTDVEVPSITPGLWTYQIEGMDLANLFALRFDKILLVEPFMIGDTVFCDANANGVQDASEGGKPGVVVELLDSLNNVVKTTTTNASGFYSFVVEPGMHQVRIAASNFVAPGVLVGLASTTGGNEKTGEVVNSNKLDYDFGYNCVNERRAQGCSPGYWKQPQNFVNYPFGITPNTLFVTVFGENAFPGKTFLQVLELNGGGLNALGRIIVSAYLNAATVQGFPATPVQVVNEFQAVFPGGDYDSLKTKYQNLQDPCPFD